MVMTIALHQHIQHTTMARPPSSANSPSRSIPSHSSSRSSSRFREFVVPIPPTPIAVAKAIRSNSRRTRLPQHQRIRALSTKLHDQRAKIETNRTKLRRVEEEKERALRKLHVQHQASTTQAVADVEQSLRTEHETKAAEQRAAIDAQLKSECETKRIEWQAERTAEDTKPLEQRIALLAQAASGEHECSGAIAALCQPAMDAVDNSNSERLQQVHQEKRAELEKLTEARSDLIWLLKQVIKAEESKKAELKKAETTTSTK